MQRFVATDSDGVQHRPGYRRAWPLPGPGGSPGAPAHVHAEEHPLVLLGADGLLEELGERIFLAEERTEEGSARLVRELPWDLPTTAGFALDCAEHALGTVTAARGGEQQQLPGGIALSDVLAEARGYLASAGASDDRRLGALARLALARRLGKEQAEVARLAAAAVTDDEDAGVDALEDARWTNLAALSSALLACVEVLRHLALPHYVALREANFEPADPDPPEADAPWVTPWGPVATSAGRLSEYVPAFVSAREAAERARQAVLDSAGVEAAQSERDFQRERLLSLLGLDPADQPSG